MYRIFIPIIYIIAEVSFQRYAFSTLSNISEHTLHILEWVSRLLMTCSVTVMCSYFIRERAILAVVAGIAFVLSAFVFDVVNSTYTSYEREMTTFAFLEHRDHIAERAHLPDTLMLMNRDGRKRGQNYMQTVLEDNKPLYSLYERANYSYAKGKRHKRGNPIEQANDALYKITGIDRSSAPEPFPKRITIKNVPYQIFAADVARWALPGVLARQNLNERTIMQASVMLPLGLVISSMGILLNTALLVLNIVKSCIKLPDYDPVYQWAIMGTVMTTFTFLWLYGVIPATLKILDYTIPY